MRQQATSSSRKHAIHTASPDCLRTLVKPVLGDSIEVMELYYRERIQSFVGMLEYLNVMDDAPEIEFLCREIVEGKAILIKLGLQKKYPSA